MENSTNRSLNYSFIAVPTNLFFALDNNLRNALTVLLQLSSVFADNDGYFFRTIEDLQVDFKMGKNLTTAVLESLYQYNLLQVKSVGFTKKGGKRQVNFYRVNVEQFKDFEKFNIYTITKNEELHLETVNYKSKDFKVTYTANTSSTEDEVITSPRIASNESSEELSSEKVNSSSQALETSNPDIVQSEIATTEQTTIVESLQDDIAETVNNFNIESVFPCEDEFEHTLQEDTEQVQKRTVTVEETPIETKTVETASVKPPTNVEVRNLGTYSERCEQLVERFKAMNCISRSEAIERCNEGAKYVKKLFNEGKITLEDKDKFIKQLVTERLKKFL